jgi:pimeloyl-ACP methyl ester carboxylesterase
MIGDSMGGMIAARYAQLHPGELAALVLSGPVIGTLKGITTLLGMDVIPSDPIDPSVLSRDEEVGRAYSEDPGRGTSRHDRLSRQGHRRLIGRCRVGIRRAARRVALPGQASGTLDPEGRLIEVDRIGGLPDRLH